jgi:hypothetical protein
MFSLDRLAGYVLLHVVNSTCCIFRLRLMIRTKILWASEGSVRTNSSSKNDDGENCFGGWCRTAERQNEK